MIRSLTLIVALCLSVASVHAAEPEWEYKVVYLAADIKFGKKPEPLKQEDSGAYLDANRTAILNKMAAEGWELITITGDSNADHAAYLKRKINP